MSSHDDLAIAEYRRAMQAQPDYADAQFNLALLLTKLDRFDDALPVWDASWSSIRTPRRRRSPSATHSAA